MSVHSHAVAPESSGAFFLDMGTERCVFQAGGLRNALRASQAVHATDVMVNARILAVIQIVAAPPPKGAATIWITPEGRTARYQQAIYAAH